MTGQLRQSGQRRQSGQPGQAREAHGPWPVRLLVAYPPGWRARYGNELELLVSDLSGHGRTSISMAADLLRGAATAWITTRKGLAMNERSKGALITVLWSWVAFAATAAWFGHDLGIISQQTSAIRLHLSGGVFLTSTSTSTLSPALPGSYHVLLAAGIVGLAATAVAAVAFAIAATRSALASGRRRTFALMAVPPVVAAAWLGGLQLLPASSPSAGSMTAAVVWLLLGVTGIAVATQAVSVIVRGTEASARTWRIGAGAATAVAAAMLVATGATIVWGIAFRTGQAHVSDASGWLVVVAIMAVTTGRAVTALIGARRPATAEPAVA